MKFRSNGQDQKWMLLGNSWRKKEHSKQRQGKAKKFFLTTIPFGMSAGSSPLSANTLLTSSIWLLKEIDQKIAYRDVGHSTVYNKFVFHF
jgi:hypothetical protein